MEKGKTPFKRNPWEINKGSKTPYGKPSYAKPQQGIPQLKFHANIKRKYTCSYCGKFGHHARDCYKRKYHDSKHRNKRNSGHGGETMNDDLRKFKIIYFRCFFVP